MRVRLLLSSPSNAFIQTGKYVLKPKIFESEYKGMQNSRSGVVGMLEVTESNFARLEAGTKSIEAPAHKEYDEFMDDSSSDKANKSD